MPRIQLVYPTVMVSVWFSKRSSMWIPPFLKAQKGMAQVNDEYTARHCLLSDSFAAYLAFLLPVEVGAQGSIGKVQTPPNPVAQAPQMHIPGAHLIARKKWLRGFPNQLVLATLKKTWRLHSMEPLHWHGAIRGSSCSRGCIICSGISRPQHKGQ